MKKSLRKISRFGLIFFILFFATSAFSAVNIKAETVKPAKCGSYAEEDYKYSSLDDLKDASDSFLCNNQGTASGHSESSSAFSWTCSNSNGDTVSCSSAKYGACNKNGEQDNGEAGVDCGGGGCDSCDESDGDTTTTDSSGDTTDTTTTGDGDNTESGGGTTKTIEYDNPLNTDNIIDVVERVADYFYYVAIAIVPIITIYAAVLFLTAAGNESQVGKARKTFIWLIIGIAILLIGSGVITLLKDILNVE